ncbi:HIT domain-containing protein [Neobacillus thermocopriae]|uniref:HIT domain-containing protein n=1 Tax=Neobacillus thermocopriae TaxID=1215031 RepID=UPI00376FAAD2
MSENLVNLKKKFKTNELKIYETDFWLWSLRPHQATLGSGILSLKRECKAFGELKKEEFTDLNNMIKVIESTLKQLFRYDIMNYLMLMMVDKQVHYHVIPRYEKEVKLFGDIWIDNSWPSIPNLGGDALDIEELNKITNYIKENLVLDNN